MVAIAVVGVFANLAVLNSGSAEGSIGTLSAKKGGRAVPHN